jgi:hypothetical protein
VNPPVVQAALTCPPPSTEAETHFTLTADSGTVVHPLKLELVVPTESIQAVLFRPCVRFQLTVATEEPFIKAPGVFARNVTVEGVARKSDTTTLLEPLLGAENIGMGDAFVRLVCAVTTPAVNPSSAATIVIRSTRTTFFLSTN